MLFMKNQIVLLTALLSFSAFAQDSVRIVSDSRTPEQIEYDEWQNLHANNISPGARVIFNFSMRNKLKITKNGPETITEASPFKQLFIDGDKASFYVVSTWCKLTVNTTDGSHMNLPKKNEFVVTSTEVKTTSGMGTSYHAVIYLQNSNDPRIAGKISCTQGLGSLNFEDHYDLVPKIKNMQFQFGKFAEFLIR